MLARMWYGTSMTNKSHTFDWQAERDGLWKRLLPSLLASRLMDKQTDALSDATDKFTNVSIAVTVNGIEVDARGFFEGLEEAYDGDVDRAATEKVASFGFADLEDAAREATAAAKSALWERLAGAGIVPPENDDYGW